MAIDFGTYWINALTGVLRVFGGTNPRLLPGDVGYYASGTHATGRVTGTSSRLKRIEGLPVSYEGDLFSIESVGDAGEVAMAYAGEELELAVGGSRQWHTADSWGEPRCVISSTVRITNFGYQDRAMIEYR